MRPTRAVCGRRRRCLNGCARLSRGEDHERRRRGLCRGRRQEPSSRPDVPPPPPGSRVGQLRLQRQIPCRPGRLRFGPRVAPGHRHAANTRTPCGAFADSLPDRWGRTLIQRAERARAKAVATAPRSMSEVGLLLGVRDDLRQGALRFRLDEQGPFLAAEESGVPALTDLPALLDIAARAERDTADYEDLRRLVRAGSSLGGARPKAHVLDAAGRVAIAKFPSDSSDTWNVMAWEKVALDLARDAGVTVPDSQLIRIGDRNVLVVDRFDRRGTARIGYASAMTMLEATDEIGRGP